jgi:tRNA modification GTPase
LRHPSFRTQSFAKGFLSGDGLDRLSRTRLRAQDMEQRDTIFALSSGRPPAAIAVVRLSGPRAGMALEALIGRIPKPRQAALASVRDEAGDEIDQALALWFPGPHSETGEDVAELQLHGGRAVVAGVLGALGRMDGLRLAEGGEFTRRAFENGKLDLTAVEGLADLVMAETQAQRRQALRHLKGLLGDRAEAWRQRLIGALALVEARIDFSDEGDVPDDLITPALAEAGRLADEIEAALADGGRGERLRDGLVVAIAGPPNAGKSTLLNRLVRREAAIVSPFAGTTRDVIEVHLDLDGYPVTLLDTAGIRENGDPVEMEGVRRARERAAAADLVLWVVDCQAPAPPPAFDAATTVWLLRNKCDMATGRNESVVFNNEQASISLSLTSVNDLVTSSGRQTNEYQFLKNEHDFVSRETPLESYDLSAATGAGVAALSQALSRHATAAVGSGEPSLLSRHRHRVALRAASEALRRAIGAPIAGREELVAEELRLAAGALGQLTGRVDVEDILDTIFRDFCIGK